MANLDTLQSDVGLIGLDVIGRNVAARLAEHHFNVAACHGPERKGVAPPDQAAWPRVRVTDNVSELMANLPHPRTILVFSDTSAPMHATLEQLLPELRHDDLVVDAGNSYFKDTAQHSRRLEERSIHFMGLGLSGGEKEARHGAIVMAGGAQEALERTRPWLATMAARIRGEPCVSYFQSAEAAHFVKMVHTAVEHAVGQLLSETFVLLQRTLLLTDEELHDASGAWLIGVLKGHLMEMPGHVLRPPEILPAGNILGGLTPAASGALGTWVAQSARELEALIPTIEVAVAGQGLGARGRRAALLAARFRHPARRFADDRESVLNELHGALDAAMVITYAQGMAMLIAASEHLGFEFNLPEIFRAWRGGTQLRTPLLEDISDALEANPDLPGLLSDDDLSQRVMDGQEKLRHAIWRAHEFDTDVPALLASLDYLDSNREAWLPTNLIKAHSGPPWRTAKEN